MGAEIEHVRLPLGSTSFWLVLKISQFYRTVTFDSLLGGSEDVLADLGVRQAIKVMPKTSKL